MLFAGIHFVFSEDKEMVKHVILWKIKDDFSEEQKNEIKANAKVHLEALVGIVPGLNKLSIYTEALESSNADMMLDSELVDEDALKGYQSHPEHVTVANTYVRPFMETRLCMDYNV